MGRLPNDGRGRIGGRAKGTPNKPKEPLPVWVSGLIDKNRNRIEHVLESPWTPEATAFLSALMVASAIQSLSLSSPEDPATVPE